ncbi:MAG: TetR/AcrR family transcriptional regulator [Clostridia bacterium]|nr:TetR/AcrR family transcriptional regulator [Clostridia bacterium]
MEAIRNLTNEELLRLSNEESKKITKESIVTAVVLLCAEKPFEKITVTEIVRKAGVSRTAFYRNYDSKEDVLKELGAGVIKKLNDFFEGKKYNRDGRALLFDLLNSIKKNASTVKLLLSSNQIVFEILCGPTYLEQFLLQETSENRYDTIVIESMIKKVIIEWFKAGMKESPEYIAAYCSNAARVIWNTPQTESE